MQATNERLYVVCQEVQGGVHADVPRKGQQVGVLCELYFDTVLCIHVQRIEIHVVCVRCVCACRAISVLLGECWKKMRSEERRAFTLQAKALADEQKRLNPDCWKRKRTNSVRTHTHAHTQHQPELCCWFLFVLCSNRDLREIKAAEKSNMESSAIHNITLCLYTMFYHLDWVSWSNSHVCHSNKGLHHLPKLIKLLALSF